MFEIVCKKIVFYIYFLVLVQWTDTKILEDFPISKGCFEAERSLSCSPNLFLTLFHDLKTEGGFYPLKLGL